MAFDGNHWRDIDTDSNVFEWIASYKGCAIRALERGGSKCPWPCEGA